MHARSGIRRARTGSLKVTRERAFYERQNFTSDDDLWAQKPSRNEIREADHAARRMGGWRASASSAALFMRICSAGGIQSRGDRLSWCCNGCVVVLSVPVATLASVWAHSRATNSDPQSTDSSMMEHGRAPRSTLRGSPPTGALGSPLSSWTRPVAEQVLILRLFAWLRSCRFRDTCMGVSPVIPAWTPPTSPALINAQKTQTKPRSTTVCA